MKIYEIFENINKDPIVIFGGRFQPFHKGHFKVYKMLCDKFKSSNVYIATSNKTNFHNATGNISPFDFAEKQKIISTLYGIPNNKIIETSNPLFFPKEIVNKFDDTYKFITVTGIKDTKRFENTKNVIQYEDNVDKSKYFYLPIFMQENGLSGTKVRKIMLSSDKDQIKTNFIKLFGKYDESICNMILTNLQKIK